MDLENLAAALTLQTQMWVALEKRDWLEKLLKDLEEPHPIYNRMVATYRFDPLEEAPI